MYLVITAMLAVIFTIPIVFGIISKNEKGNTAI